MLRSLYVMLDYHITATDGELGRVQDFLFDDESWIVHYLVAETATSPKKRDVLIAPFAAGRPDWETKRLPVLLSCEQIRTSPPLESDLPISLQSEAGPKVPGSHLRSMREMLGYGIHAADGEVGSLEDFIIEDTLWGIHHAIVGLKELPLRSILVAPESIRSISWPGKAAWVNSSLQEIANWPDFDPTTPVNHDQEHRFFDYYGRPVLPHPPFASANRPGAQQH
ncbi:MAG: hypothetical protein LAO55_15790 [Acidobacteriia bacterium]|nr:hypothetical protein [Terriglobia bacterium]